MCPVSVFLAWCTHIDFAPAFFVLVYLRRFHLDLPSAPLALQTKQNEDMREASGGLFSPA